MYCMSACDRVNRSSRALRAFRLWRSDPTPMAGPLIEPVRRRRYVRGLRRIAHHGSDQPPAVCKMSADRLANEPIRSSYQNRMHLSPLVFTQRTPSGVLGRPLDARNRRGFPLATPMALVPTHRSPEYPGDLSHKSNRDMASPVSSRVSSCSRHSSALPRRHRSAGVPQPR
jgi:hypothetical protein